MGVPQRPTYDLIADRVLGPNVGQPSSFLDIEHNYASHVAHRLTELRQRLEAKAVAEPVPSETGFVGVEDDGTPVWSHVLSEQRGRPSRQLSESLAPPTEEDGHHPVHTLNIAPSWPKRMPFSSSRTFKQWFVAEENFEAALLRACC